MNTAALERHIIDTVKEWQMKIGYRREEMKLYYPDVSLAGLLELAEGWTEASLKEALQEFSKETKGRLGGVQISNVKDRYCVAVPAAGCTYIHENEPDSAFLRSFLDVITGLEPSMQGVEQCFADAAAMNGEHYVKKTGSQKGSEWYFISARCKKKCRLRNGRSSTRMCTVWRRMILALRIIVVHGQIFRNWSVRIHR